MYTLNKLLVYSQPAHLAAAEGLLADDPTLPVRRARYVRKTLGRSAARG